MARGLSRRHPGDRREVYRAGTELGFHPLAVRAMAKLGIDISGLCSKFANGFARRQFGYAPAIGGQAREACPVFPGAASQLQWRAPDAAAIPGHGEERLETFRLMRDESAARIWGFVSGGQHREKREDTPV